MHPWLSKYPIDKNSTRLIIGTHPPMPYTAELKYFYGNMYEFWRLLQIVYSNEKILVNNKPEINRILGFLSKYEFSITDIVYETYNAKFSTDDEMQVKDLNPFLKNWLINSNIEEIYFTSFSGTNGALPLFKKWIKKEYGKKVKFPPEKSWNNYTTKLVIGEKEYKLIKLYSPSPTARRGISRSPIYKLYLSKNLIKDADSFRVMLYKKLFPPEILS
jgi:hypothetical protein